MTPAKLAELRETSTNLKENKMNKQDISTETRRVYHYPGAKRFVIDGPLILYWKRDEMGDSHRVVTKDGEVFYPVRGWLAISWLPADPSAPVQF